MLLLIWFGIFLVRFGNSYQAEAKIKHYEGKAIKVVGRIASEPLLQGVSQRFNIGRVQVVTELYPKYEYGQKVAVAGILQRRVINRWSNQFSLMYPSIKVVEADNVNFIRYRLIKFRQGIEVNFNRSLPEPEASLLAGIVLGVKRGLPGDFYEALRKTGTMHIVVASGYNVTIIIGTVVLYLAGYVKRRTAICLGIIAVGIYTVMAGLQPAIIRAAIMGSLAYLGQLLGKQSVGLRLLIIAGGLMLLFEPLLVFDLGFQLSVAATGGLLLLGEKTARIFNRVWLVGKAMGETAAAQIMVTPILLSAFGQVNAFSILINSLILWLVPFIMLGGVILAILPFQPVAWLVYVPLTIMTRVIMGFGNLW